MHVVCNSLLSISEPEEFNEVQDVQFKQSWNKFDFNSVASQTYVVIDDYVMADEKSRKEFLSIVNFVLRHRQIGLCIVIHQVVLSNMYSELMLCGHIVLTCSPSSLHYLQKVKKLYLGMKLGYDYISQNNFYVLYTNKVKNYSIAIKPNFILDRMWTNTDEYIIYKKHENCMQNEEETYSQDSLLNMPWFQDVIDTYSRHKKKVVILIHILIKNKLLPDTDSLLIGNERFKSNRMHLIDFLSICLSVKKLKLSKKNVQFLKTLFNNVQYQFPKTVFPLYIRKYMI